MKKLLLLLAFLGTSSLIFATTYYVSNTGSDTDSGTSTSTSWQTLQKVNTFVFQAGDSILFKCNDIWRGQLHAQSGNIDNHIYYGAYDSGEKPIFMGSINFTNQSNWTNLGGNIWTTNPSSDTGIELITNPSLDTDDSNWTFYAAIEADATGNRSTDDYYSAPASYKINCTLNGENNYDIQLSTQGINIEANKLYKLNFKAKCSSSFTFGGIHLMQSGPPYNVYYSTYFVPPTIETDWSEHTIFYNGTTTASDAMINFFLGDSIPEGSIFYIDDISFREVVLNSDINSDIGNLIFNNEEDFGVKKEFIGELLEQGDYYFDDDNLCVSLYSTSNPGVFYTDIEFAETKNIIEQSEKSYIKYENLELKYGSAHGIAGGNTSNITISACTISYIGGGKIYLPTYGYVRYGNGVEFWGNANNNIVEGCHIFQIYDAALTNQNRGTPCTQSNIIYRNNFISNSEWSFEYWNRPIESVTEDIYFINNTCLNAGITWAHSQRPDQRGRHINIFQNDAATTNFNILNNIFWEATSASLYILRETDLDFFNIDYNCYYQSISDTVIDIRWGFELVNAYFMTNFNDYQTEYSQDNNSIASDPELTNPNNNNIELLSNSPCIDNGSPDGDTQPVGEFDFFGNIRILDGDANSSAIIDIGCYESPLGSKYVNINKDNIYSIYPNPANYGGSINLNLESYPCDIAIIDLNGKTVKQNIAYDGSKINLLGIKPGMYFVKIAHTEKTITKKLVIK